MHMQCVINIVIDTFCRLNMFVKYAFLTLSNLIKIHDSYSRIKEPVNIYWGWGLGGWVGTGEIDIYPLKKMYVLPS